MNNRVISIAVSICDNNYLYQMSSADSKLDRNSQIVTMIFARCFNTLVEVVNRSYMIRFILCLTTCVFFFACSTPRKEQPLRSDIGLLSQTISLPYPPDSVLWLVEDQTSSGRAIGPSDYTILAVLYFSDEQFAKIRTDLAQMDDISNAIYLEKSFAKEWFPPALRTKFYLEGDYTRIISSVYPAKLFHMSPYLDGFCVVADTNEVLVCMSTS
jgi:hypothetical protein